METIRTLYLTGQHGHDWRKSAGFMKDLLEGSGIFSVDITTSPDESLTDEGLMGDIELLFLDYSGPRFCPEAEEAFVAAVSSGVGLVILHGSTVGFEGWAPYEKMAGLLWREGTFHGDFGCFNVSITEPENPITKGVPTFSTMDELYCGLVPTTGSPYRVLATGYSDPEVKDWAGRPGSGRNEPVMLVNGYGKGRIFYQALGHVWPIDYGNGFMGHTTVALENHWFRITTLRGCEWAARGYVSI